MVDKTVAMLCHIIIKKESYRMCPFLSPVFGDIVHLAVEMHQITGGTES